MHGPDDDPDFLRQLDYAYRSFKRTDPYLQELTMKPSEYIRRAVKFTPFPDEDVGLMIRDAGPDLFMFSSDYPHPEGTRDPLGKFERTMEGIDEDARDQFFRRNYEQLLNMPGQPATLAAARRSTRPMRSSTVLVSPGLATTSATASGSERVSEVSTGAPSPMPGRLTPSWTPIVAITSPPGCRAPYGCLDGSSSTLLSS